MQAPENLVVRGLVMIDDSRRLPWGRDKNFVCVCVYVLCMFFSVVGSNKTWQRKFSSDFTRALRKCLFYKLQRPAII